MLICLLFFLVHQRYFQKCCHHDISVRASCSRTRETKTTCTNRQTAAATVVCPFRGHKHNGALVHGLLLLSVSAPQGVQLNDICYSRGEITLIILHEKSNMSLKPLNIGEGDGWKTSNKNTAKYPAHTIYTHNAYENSFLGLKRGKSDLLGQLLHAYVHCRRALSQDIFQFGHLSLVLLADFLMLDLFDTKRSRSKKAFTQGTK